MSDSWVLKLKLPEKENATWMNQVSEIIPGCTPGVSVRCWWETSFSKVSTASKTCTNVSSSDSVISGSFALKEQVYTRYYQKVR